MTSHNESIQHLCVNDIAVTQCECAKKSIHTDGIRKRKRICFGSRISLAVVTRKHFSRMRIPRLLVRVSVAGGRAGGPMSDVQRKGEATGDPVQ